MSPQEHPGSPPGAPEFPKVNQETPRRRQRAPKSHSRVSPGGCPRCHRGVPSSLPGSTREAPMTPIPLHPTPPHAHLGASRDSPGFSRSPRLFWSDKYSDGSWMPGLHVLRLGGSPAVSRLQCKRLHGWAAFYSEVELVDLATSCPGLVVLSCNGSDRRTSDGSVWVRFRHVADLGRAPWGIHQTVPRVR